MSFEGLPVFSGISVPQPDSIVLAAASDGVPVGTERKAYDRSCMASEGLPVFSGISVPQAYGIVLAAASDGVAIGTERYA